MEPLPKVVRRRVSVKGIARELLRVWTKERHYTGGLTDESDCKACLMGAACLVTGQPLCDAYLPLDNPTTPAAQAYTRFLAAFAAKRPKLAEKFDKDQPDEVVFRTSDRNRPKAIQILKELSK